MARLTFLISLLATLLFVVHTACASRWEEDSCSRQLERVNLRHCEKHIWQRIQQKQQQEEEEEGEGEEDVLKLRGINYNIPRRKSSSSSSSSQQQQEEEAEEELNKCCEQFDELNSPQCQCRALQQIMESQSEQLQGKEQAKLMEQELKKLPRMCGMGPMRCQDD